MECSELLVIVVLVVLLLLYHNREHFESINTLFSPPTNPGKLRSEVKNVYDSRYTKAWTDVTDN